MTHEDVLINVWTKCSLLFYYVVSDGSTVLVSLLPVFAVVRLVLIAPMSETLLKSLYMNDIQGGGGPSLVVLQLTAGVEELLTECAQPVPVFDHVRLQVYGGGKTSITDRARHVFVVPLAVLLPETEGQVQTEVVVWEDVGCGDGVLAGVLGGRVTALTLLSVSPLIVRHFSRAVRGDFPRTGLRFILGELFVRIFGE